MLICLLLIGLHHYTGNIFIINKVKNRKSLLKDKFFRGITQEPGFRSYFLLLKYTTIAVITMIPGVT
jgi:hypothetical protein